MEDVALFEHSSSFEAGEVSGNIEIGRLEAHYEELFAEVIEDGIITAEERARLDRSADKLGLDRHRIHELERALTAAYEARHRVVIRDASDQPAASLVLPDLLPKAEAASNEALLRRIEELTRRVAELEHELEEARAEAAIDIDLSDARTSEPAASDDPAELLRQLRRDPRDAEALHALYRSGAIDLDRKLMVARVLVHLGAANADERRTGEAHKTQGLIQPSASLSRDAWRRLLFHPDEEVLTGDIFATIASAVLFGHVAMLRQGKALPALDPATRLDPRTSTVQAVRCFAWAASILGMTAPAFHADPSYAGIVELLVGVPPSSRLGKLALSGRTPAELAFLAGRHLAYYRQEHFLRMLVPSIPELEDLFLAALTIGSPSLPLSAEMRRRIDPIARAIEPILEPMLIDRLRGHFLRFVEDGGRTNLQRWAVASDHTATRAGFLLCGDLAAAQRMLELEKPAAVGERMTDLLEFAVSDRLAALRKQIGIAVEG